MNLRGIILAVLLPMAAMAAGGSAHYTLSADVLDAAGAPGASVHYATGGHLLSPAGIGTSAHYQNSAGFHAQTVLGVILTPTVTSVRPVIGDVNGGAIVVITGTNLTGTGAVYFGGIAMAFTVDSDTQITAITYAQSAGVVNVTVVTPGGIGTGIGLFEFGDFPALDDAVTRTTGTTIAYPLANDAITETIISDTSEPAVAITDDGRSLIIPTGYTGSFTYTTTAATSATVTVTAAASVAGASRWQGLLYDASGAIAGWMQASKNIKGAFTSSLKVGIAPGKASFRLTAGTTTVPTALGALTVTEDADGRLNITLGAVTGSLRPGFTAATVAQHNIALASIHSAIPGGGFVRAFVKARGDIAFSSKLPDGRALTAKGRLADNGSFVIYTLVGKTLPKAIVAGEFTTANLAATDVTGELSWAMQPQVSGLHNAGLATTLTANGCVFTVGAPLPNGAGTITVAGGGLAADSTTATTATVGKPTIFPLVPSWTVHPLKGTFAAKVKDPARLKSVNASGIYLQKTNSAWGFFPGFTVGGRIELSVP